MKYTEVCGCDKIKPEKHLGAWILFSKNFNPVVFFSVGFVCQSWKTLLLLNKHQTWACTGWCQLQAAFPRGESWSNINRLTWIFSVTFFLKATTTNAHSNILWICFYHFSRNCLLWKRIIFCTMLSPLYSNTCHFLHVCKMLCCKTIIVWSIMLLFLTWDESPP